MITSAVAVIRPTLGENNALEIYKSITNQRLFNMIFSGKILICLITCAIGYCVTDIAVNSFVLILTFSQLPNITLFFLLRTGTTLRNFTSSFGTTKVFQSLRCPITPVSN